MADTATPQTPTKPPTKKLFKPSTKTKTPTPVRKGISTHTTPRSAQSTALPNISGSQELRRATDEKTQSAPKSVLSDPASGKLPDYAASDETGDTPLGPVDDNALNPNDTVSRSTGPSFSLSRNTTGPLKRGTSETGERADSAPDASNAATGDANDLTSGSTDQNASNLTDALKSPTEIANYFADSGNQEMSSFVKALAGKTSSDDSTNKANDIIANSKEPLPGALEELPTDDSLVAEPNGGTKEVPGESLDEPGHTNSEGQPDAMEGTTGTALQNARGQEQVSNVANKTPDLPDPSSVSQEAEGVRDVSETNRVPTKGAFSEDGQNPSVGEPDTSKISKDAKVNVPPSGDLERKTSLITGEEGDAAEDAQSFDNMGKPTHIERSIEIPFQRPPRRQSLVHNPPVPPKPNFGNIANNLGDVKDLPSTENLASTDDLQDIPGDPPEEILDPSVHSASANVSPIPNIPKITPIGISPPANLSQLARGLEDKMVDDVGNVVDESGKVLGHVVGDLPAMVGKRVAKDGGIYGDDGELIGYVTENFTESTTTENPGGPWGGLQIDHYGNILDAAGNVIGRFFQKPGEKGGPPLSTAGSQQNPKQEEKPKVNAHTGGSPSDIFLDVKSTTDGIQLTIRIPTTFGKQQQQDSQ
ncbi:hypothetical protein DL764_004059 [Monosporascus ibericus]|uniref:Lea domain protein n=1 Tax=Monosporascus ibericus TaxID=155417 RepID=A0A4Q4THN3_9PEZI|nr:hypothetical protein DL764_004059 [Monosporascus ibericus]